MKKLMTLLAVLALALTLLAGCGRQEDTAPPADPAPVQSEAPTEPAPTVQPEDKKEDEPPADAQPETPAPEETVPAGTEPAEPQPEEKENEQSGEKVPASTDESKPEPAAVEPEPEPAPEPEPEPEPEETLPEDGTYTASVTLEGGSGRATVESPVTLRCEDGKFWATIVWSSPNFDYMKVDGEKYLQTNTEGNSTFEIPVSAFDQKLDVIADTVAMSEPHEVEYTLTFDSASLQKH